MLDFVCFASKPPTKKGTLLSWFPTKSKSITSVAVKKEVEGKREEEEEKEPVEKRPKLE